MADSNLKVASRFLPGPAIGGELVGPAAPLASASEGFCDLLAAENAALALTSYQTGRLYSVGRSESGALDISHAGYAQATGLAADGDRLWLATLTDIVELRAAPNPGARHDVVYVPRKSHHVGDVQIHQMGTSADGELIFVNTLYSCLARLSDIHSFACAWRPPFISALAGEDRCHLNGLAMDSGKPRFVSAFAASDAKEGWRAGVERTGVVIDVVSGELVATGLTMPHSPRLRGGELWIANSGTGEIGRLDLASGTFDPLCFVPGYVRGMTLLGDHVVVCLSQFRADRAGVETLRRRLERDGAEPWCGIQVIHASTAKVTASLRFGGVTTEIFDVEVLPGARNPRFLGLQFRDLQRFVSIEP